jgi:DNA-binding GntR family transcriptional regulator
MTSVAEERTAIDPDSPDPLWLQLAAVLRDAIERGELVGRIPSAVQLGRTWQVSRDTALHAISQLQGEGLIVSQRGRGSFVVRPEDR